MAWTVAFLKLGLHLAFSTRGYGFFGDELYYIACAPHLDFGYVDHPPLSIWILWAWQGLVGESLAALRVLPGLLGGAAVVLAGGLARELGGRSRAQALCAVVIALAPVNGVVFGYDSMNALDVVLWLAAFLSVSRVLRSGRPRDWIGLGTVLGLGLSNKLRVLWFGLGLCVALLATPHRRVFRSRRSTPHLRPGSEPERRSSRPATRSPARSIALGRSGGFPARSAGTTATGSGGTAIPTARWS